MPLTIGALTSAGYRVIRLVPSELNDSSHVQLNPNSGRYLLRNETTGQEYFSAGRLESSIPVAGQAASVSVPATAPVPYIYQFLSTSAAGGASTGIGFPNPNVGSRLIFIAIFQAGYTAPPPAGYDLFGEYTFGFGVFHVYTKIADGTETSVTAVASGNNAPVLSCFYEISACVLTKFNFSPTNKATIADAPNGSLVIGCMGGCYGSGSGQGVTFGSTLGWDGVTQAQPYISARFEHFRGPIPTNFSYPGSTGGTATGIGTLAIACTAPAVVASSSASATPTSNKSVLLFDQ